MGKRQRGVEQPIWFHTLWGHSDEFTVKWSPDGRYLAFSAALKGTVANIFLYDVENQSITQLTDSQTNVAIWSWAPDGKSFLYRKIATYGLEPGLVYANFSGAYLHPLIGEEKLLYIPESSEDLIWLGDPSTVLVYRFGLDGYRADLRELNIKNGAMRTLYKDSFTGLSLFSEPRSILLNLSNNAYNIYDFQSGIYIFNLDTLQREILIPCEFCFTTWDENNKWIHLNLFWEDERGVKFYNEYGKEIKAIKGEVGYYNGSPDGKWFILSDGRYQLFDNQFYFVKELYGNNLIWRPDSTGFYLLDGNCQDQKACISFYDRNEGWNLAFQRNIPSLESELYIIQP